MPVIIKTALVSGLKKLVNSNENLRKEITDFMFAKTPTNSNIDWSKAKIFVPCDPTAVRYISKELTLLELIILKEYLSKNPNAARPGIAYMGGNNGKYNRNSLETRMATLLCEANGYSIDPFKNGIESEIIHKMVAEVLPDSVFGSVQEEKESSNRKANWENAIKKGFFKDVKTVVILSSAEYAVRSKGTLIASMKANGLNPNEYNIVSWPYTAKISSDALKKVQEQLEINLKVPAEGGISDADNWTKSSWGIYRTFIEMLSVRKYSQKGDVYLTPEQQEKLKEILSVKRLALTLASTLASEAKAKAVNLFKSKNAQRD